MSRNTLLIIGLFLTWAAMGQPMKKANVIVIESNAAPVELLKEFAVYLLDNGYQVAQRDVELGTLSTDWREYSKSLSSVMKINVRVKESDTGSMLYLRGGIKMDLGLYGATEGDVCNCGMKGSAQKAAFEELQRLASAFSEQVSYQIL